jgi:hypothetical protein
VPSSYKDEVKAVKFRWIAGTAVLFVALQSAGWAQATQTTAETKRELKQEQKADKSQAKADKAERKALGTKQQKKADKAQDKASKQESKIPQ